MQDKKLSVIVPVYNVERYIRKCLDSLVNQTYKNLEIILVDDGSPDNSGAICDEYASRDSRVRVVHKENGGLCNARNTGLEMASGDFLCFVDDDDWLELNAYEELLAKFDEHDVDAVFFGFTYYKDHSDVDPLHFRKSGIVDRQEALTQITLRDYGYEAATWNKIIKLDFSRGHIFRPEFVSGSEDADFWISCVVACDNVFLEPKSYYHHLIRSDSAGHQKTLNFYYSNWKAWKRIAEVCTPYPKALHYARLEETCRLITLLAAYYVNGMTREREELARSEKIPFALLFQPNILRFMRRGQAILLLGLMALHAPKSLVKAVLTKQRF